jgi:hypothetical protein
MWTSLPSILAAFGLDSCISEKVTDKVNHPKTSANLTIGTNKNVEPDSRGRNPDRMDEHRKLWLRVG